MNLRSNFVCSDARFDRVAVSSTAGQIPHVQG